MNQQGQGAQSLQKVPHLTNTWLTSSRMYVNTWLIQSSIKRLATCCYPSIAWILPQDSTMFLYSLLVRSLHPFFYTCFTSTADCQEVRRTRARLRNYVTHNVTWYSTSAKASNVCTVLETPASMHWVQSPRYEHSSSKRHCAHKIERDWCKSHSDSLSQFWRRPFEKKKKD